MLFRMSLNLLYIDVVVVGVVETGKGRFAHCRAGISGCLQLAEKSFVIWVWLWMKSGKASGPVSNQACAHTPAGFCQRLLHRNRLAA